MNVRLKTNINTEAKLNDLQSSLQVSSKAAVIRLAIAYSLKINGDPRVVDGIFKKYDIKKQTGADYVRFTIFGDDELFYKVMMSQHLKRKISDDEFFPELTNAHIDRGILELEAELRLAKNREKLLINLLK